MGIIVNKRSKKMEFDLAEYKRIAEEVFKYDSPSGFTHNLMKYVKDYVEKLNYECVLTNKGTLVVKIKGNNSKKNIAIASHCDTLGLMVRSINSNGTLNVTAIGGPLLATLDGEYAKLYTRDNRIYDGTIIAKSSSVHVYEDANSAKRDIDNLIFRIDEKVFNETDVKKLGIDNGDFICYDSKYTFTSSDFLKSRFIDDKASASLLLYFLYNAKKYNFQFAYNTYIYFTVYEEVGHGASSLISPVDEFVAVDMGCVGKDLAGNEYAVSICAKDSSGPFDYELTTKLIELAKNNNLNYVVDIFPMYGSDIRAARNSGYDFKCALIGPGVHSSHGMERTHKEALMNTYNLIFCYLKD